MHLTITTTDIGLVLHLTYERYIARFTTYPACIILSEHAWLQLRLQEEPLLHFRSHEPTTYRGIPLAVSQTLPVAIEMVGAPGTLHSLSAEWVKKPYTQIEEGRRATPYTPMTERQSGVIKE